MKNTGKTSTSNTVRQRVAYSNSDASGIRRRYAGINGPDLAGWVVP